MNAHLFPLLKFFFRRIFFELRAFESYENRQILRFLRFKAGKWPKMDMVLKYFFLSLENRHILVLYKFFVRALVWPVRLLKVGHYISNILL